MWGWKADVTTHELGCCDSQREQRNNLGPEFMQMEFPCSRWLEGLKWQIILQEGRWEYQESPGGQAVMVYVRMLETKFWFWIWSVL